jgi:hypothetical protein
MVAKHTEEVYKSCTVKPSTYERPPAMFHIDLVYTLYTFLRQLSSNNATLHEIVSDTLHSLKQVLIFTFRDLKLLPNRHV